MRGRGLVPTPTKIGLEAVPALSAASIQLASGDAAMIKDPPCHNPLVVELSMGLRMTHVLHASWSRACPNTDIAIAGALRPTSRKGAQRPARGLRGRVSPVACPSLPRKAAQGWSSTVCNTSTNTATLSVLRRLSLAYITTHSRSAPCENRVTSSHVASGVAWPSLHRSLRPAQQGHRHHACRHSAAVRAACRRRAGTTGLSAPRKA